MKKVLFWLFVSALSTCRNIWWLSHIFETHNFKINGFWMLSRKQHFILPQPYWHKILHYFVPRYFIHTKLLWGFSTVSVWPKEKLELISIKNLNYWFHLGDISNESRPTVCRYLNNPKNVRSLLLYLKKKSILYSNQFASQTVFRQSSST